jgi:hypothetical protein
MDLKTREVLALIKSHSRIKKFLTIFCYFLIIGGVFIYAFYALNQSRVIKLVSEYKANPNDYKTEKIMTNPRIKFQYNDNQIYNIRAKKAFHKDANEAVLQDVFAEGEIGKITAGELKIDEDGDHLVFTRNPILILNKTTR